MKVTIERDDGQEVVYQEVTDYFLTVRQLERFTNGTELVGEFRTHSASAGPHLRDLVKEIEQSCRYMQRLLVKQEDGPSVGS